MDFIWIIAAIAGAFWIGMNIGASYEHREWMKATKHLTED